MAGICDDDGTPLITRKDDSEEVVTERIRTYDEVTRPVLAYYQDRKYHQIRGDRSPGYIFEEITRYSGTDRFEERLAAAVLRPSGGLNRATSVMPVAALSDASYTVAAVRSDLRGIATTLACRHRRSSS